MNPWLKLHRAHENGRKAHLTPEELAEVVGEPGVHARIVSAILAAREHRRKVVRESMRRGRERRRV